VLLKPGALEYRVLGGTFDFYFFAGSSPTEVVEQYSEVVGRPAQVPYWALGFHLCRYGYWNLEGMKRVVDAMRKADIPLETIWSDLEYMDRKRNFVVSPEDFP
jgi:alpha-glucosidase (family GH31 glycosyl hydrolase)